MNCGFLFGIFSGDNEEFNTLSHETKKKNTGGLNSNVNEGKLHWWEAAALLACDQVCAMLKI